MKRGILLVSLLALSVAAFGGASFAAMQAAPTQSKPDEMPTDAKKLFEWAQSKMNQGFWKEADRGWKSYLEKYPEGEQAEQAYAQLGNLHLWQSRHHQEAREWYAKLCEKFPKSQNLWHYRMQIAQSYQYQNLRDKAIEEYMKIGKEAPDSGTRASAIQQAWSLKGKYFYMHVNGTFTAGQQPEVNVQLHNIDKVLFRATHIPFDQILKHLGGENDGQNFHNALEKVGADGRKVLKEWTADYTYDKQNNWRNEQVKVPSTDAGIYIVEAEHEGVTMAVTLFVTRFGIVTKSAAGKLIVFAQDRATSKPVEGMEIKVLSKEHALQGKTNAEGLFISPGYHGGAIVGLKDSEIVTTESHYYERMGDHPLLYISTDRPIYRPNQVVNFRVIHRWEQGENLKIQPGEQLLIEIKDTKGNKIYEKTHALNDFGTTTGTFTLGDEPALGEYTILARPEKKGEHYNEWEWQYIYHGHRYQENFGKFRVDEYRKPEYKVDVEFKKSPVLQGDTVEATVNAQYYFGSPVTDAEVQYIVYRRGHWWSWRCWAYYYDWYADEEEERYEGKRAARWWGYGEQVLQGAGKTDKDGKLKVVFPAQKWEYDAVYTVTAKVTDLSRRVVDGAGTVKATRAEFGLGMTLDKYVYKPGDKINAKIRATTADDKPVADTKITVKVHDRHWRNDKYDDHLLFEGETRTDAHGVAEINYTPDKEGGYLWLVAEAQDRKENRVTAEHYAWLCGNAWYGDHVNLNGVDLILDKKTYERGDTAQVLVTSQFKNLTFLFTIEGKEIYHQEVVSIKGHTKTIEIKLDKPVYAPNVFISVSAIKENAVIQKQKMIVVNPSEKFVTVEIKPDKSQYRPRQKARYEVTTRDSMGRPVAAEVALGIVDESIYALQDEYVHDIRKHFIHRKGVEVATSSSLFYSDWGRADKKDKQAAQFGAGGARGEAMAKSANAPAAAREATDGLQERRKGLADEKASGKPGAAYAETEVRSNFADTMLWKTVTTGADGKAVVEVDIPDNLTTWRTTARAVTSDSRFGQELNTVVARKNVIVRLETPRFFTQNDETIISAIAHNYLEAEKEMKIEFAAEGIEVAGEKTMIVKVAPEGQKRFDWKAKIKAAGKAKITVKALSDEDSDAMQLVIPVLAHGAMKWDSKGGIVDGKVVEKIVIPAGSVKGGSELVVVVSPTHAAMVLEALEYLAGYPYGCVEQTMSRFLPTVIVSQAMQKLGIENKELKAELPQMVAAGLQRLYNFQQPDGGWGWWQHDQSNAWITAYVVFGLAMAQQADRAVDANVLARGVQSLHSHLAQAKDANLQAYILYSLSVAGKRNDVVRDQLTDKLGELNSYAKALLALVLAKDGRNAKDVVAELAKEAKVVGGAAHFEGGQMGHWMDHGMEVTAAALRAFVKVDPKNALVPKLVNWLSIVRTGNYWASTKQTAMVIFAMTDYIAQTGEMNPDMTLGLTVNGAKIYSERVTKDTWQKFEGMRKFTGAQIREGENEIVIEHTGNGAPVWSIYAKYYAEAEDLKPSEGGIQIERTYSRVINENGKRILQKLESGDTVTSGDEVEVTIHVKADRNYEWLMMEDPLPSGFEPIREYWDAYGRWGRHWNFWYSRKEFHDQKVSIAMTALWQGTHTANYVMRAETPGDFHALPSSVFNMYHPQIGGNSAEFRIKVVDKK